MRYLAFLVEEEKTAEWASAFTLALLVFIGELLMLYGHALRASQASLLRSLGWSHFLISVAALILLLVFRQRSSRVLTVSTFLATILPVYVLTTLLHFENIRLQVPSMIFVGQKLCFLTLSILVPGPIWLNAVLMAGFAMQSVGLWIFSDSSFYFSQNLEPWVSILFALVGASLLIYRYLYQRMARQLAVANAQGETMRTMAHVFLSVRDLANGPLQSLKIGLELLHRKDPNAQELREIESSIKNLCSLNAVFSHYEQRLPWENESLMSIHEILRCLKNLEQVPPRFDLSGYDNPARDTHPFKELPF